MLLRNNSQTQNIGVRLVSWTMDVIMCTLCKNGRQMRVHQITHADRNKLYAQRILTVAYLGHGEKTNISANPHGRNTNPPGRSSQSARAE